VNSNNNELKFSAFQRRDLSALGLNDKEVAQLENHALPLVRNYRHELPSVEDTRATLDDLGRALSNSQRQLKKLNAPSGAGVASARRMLAIADYEYGRTQKGEPFKQVLEFETLGQRLAALKAALKEAEDVVALASANLPKVQRRAEVHWEAIDAIHVAVPRLRPSRGLKSTFSQVVDICYQAAGYGDIKLEATIKKYMKIFDQDQASVPRSSAQG
jgi:hypothetical protein